VLPDFLAGCGGSLSMEGLFGPANHPEAEEVLADLGKVGVDLESVTEQLQRDGVKAFADSFDQLLSALSEKRRVGLA